MGVLGDSLNRAEENTATRPIPKSAGAKMRFLVRRLKGTRALAELLGISQRTVERYVKDQLKQPRPELAARLDSEVRARWQPRVRDRAKKRAATATGIVVETRARFGFTAAPGSTDDGRIRLITQHLPPEYAARLFDAQSDGATDRQLQAVVAEGLQEIYFKDQGRRAEGLSVEFTDIDYVELDF
ncbi:telomere-protecting terminal protein Tpg [Streptomyces jumonjinensis]|uniref:XRE family transcriptional regulator n=1 Tax=Streptomyces jumonjinensis TaxID=1945 RepID=A0A646KRE3_STRJU|nr:XRE family transcriptional regulator [Streptomyces jumonjinensis]MQT04670.1 XRE family transcriptional regulator [Streptomyces jumonjinensis]